MRYGLARPLYMAVALFFALGASTLHGADATAEMELDRGRSVFNEKCSGCHGINASGTDKGPPLVHRIYHPNHHSDLSFRWAVERGVRAHHWGFGDMPKVAGVAPQDVELIIRYVRKLQKDAGIF